MRPRPSGGRKVEGEEAALVAPIMALIPLSSSLVAVHLHLIPATILSPPFPPGVGGKDGRSLPTTLSITHPLALSEGARLGEKAEEWGSRCEDAAATVSMCMHPCPTILLFRGISPGVSAPKSRCAF
mmetsp:Transcript_10911/g.25352  ORF Transcript_10911/g.25352 Transcript_10911/m.25352 type:complete len:127 (-) Transcript_10911:2-382(-)